MDPATLAKTATLILGQAARRHANCSPTASALCWCTNIITATRENSCSGLMQQDRPISAIRRRTMQQWQKGKRMRTPARRQRRSKRWVGLTLPIYFGLDFDLKAGTDVAKDENGTEIQYSDGTPVSNDTVLMASDAYFGRLKQIFGSGRLGIYGNGFANERLLDARLVKYSWVSASVSYNKTAYFLRTGRWHLFQQSDYYWFMGSNCPSGLDVRLRHSEPGHERHRRLERIRTLRYRCSPHAGCLQHAFCRSTKSADLFAKG